jgi:hypothetical protein
MLSVAAALFDAAASRTQAPCRPASRSAGNHAENLVVIATCENPNFIRSNLINQPMLLINAPRPTPGQLVLQRFRLADA